MTEITPDRSILGQHCIPYCSFRNMPGRGGDAGNAALPTLAEHHEAMGVVNTDVAAIYQYLNFNQIG